MTSFNSKEFEKSLQCELNSLNKKTKKDYLKILDSFNKNNIYLIGGFVRDSILRILHEYTFPINDLDILVNEEIPKEMSQNFENTSTSNLGGLKIIYPNFSIDLFSMKDSFIIKRNKDLTKKIENFLSCCDFSTSAIAYNVGQNKFYGNIRDIINKEINILYDDLEPGAGVAKLILHSNKMGFSLSERAKNFLKENYNKTNFEKVKDWLKYKNKENLFPLVFKKWKEISNC